MESQKFCVYNRTRDTLLGLEAVQVDTATETLKRQVEYLAVQAETGLWLNPYRGIPLVPGIAPFDLVCLDQEYRIVRLIQSVVAAEMLPSTGEAYSALVLPANSLSSSGSQVGDELVICPPQDLKQQFSHLSLQSRSSGRFQTIPELNGSEPHMSRMPMTVMLSDESNHRAARIKNIREQNVYEDEIDYDAPTRVTLKMRLLRWLVSDRRGTKRTPKPRLIAYRWTGGNPQAHHIGDISDTGLYLVTDERWIPGTKILITLQRTDSDGEGEEESIAIEAKVVRWGADGEGLAFVGAHPQEGFGQIWPDIGANRKELKQFLRRLFADESEYKVA
ncbi:MAG TPA: PilZ domain-containing protein [Terracidiphilus sp.]|nr:PilZ domain-containing protein [Terracidiphilus sp.]